MKIASILLAVAAALTIAACGDDDEDTEPQPLASGATGATGEAGATGTMAAFIAAADEVCKQADRELADEAEAQYPEGPPTGDDAVAFGEDVVIPNLQAQHDGIAEIPPPAGEEDAITSLLDSLQAGIDELAEDPGSFVETTAIDDAARQAQDLGFKACGS